MIRQKLKMEWKNFLFCFFSVLNEPICKVDLTRRWKIAKPSNFQTTLKKIYLPKWFNFINLTLKTTLTQSRSKLINIKIQFKYKISSVAFLYSYNCKIMDSIALMSQHLFLICWCQWNETFFSRKPNEALTSLDVDGQR